MEKWADDPFESVNGTKIIKLFRLLKEASSELLADKETIIDTQLIFFLYIHRIDHHNYFQNNQKLTLFIIINMKVINVPNITT